MSALAAEPQPSTRQRILDAALELFALHGFAGTSIRAIARQVGLRESSLYNHFPGKHALYEALFDAHGPASSAERLRGAHYQALRGDPRGFCRLYAAELLAQWRDPREQAFNDLITTERHRLGPERTRYYEALFSAEYGLAADYFRRFALAGLIRPPISGVADPAETARLFMAAMTFVRLEHFIMPSQPSPDALARAALDRSVEHFLGLIAPEGGWPK